MTVCCMLDLYCIGACYVSITMPACYMSITMPACFGICICVRMNIAGMHGHDLEFLEGTLLPCASM